ncbi:ABC-type amino acid transport system permease subunit [Bradyrhizobium sp. USDA 4518]|uniref:Amino acid ABC transporter permease n=1 Tax=Bradyrhizobium brasilense TaxID=1419277 RepID=A0ABY8J9H1_9BRAD|nr:MULTISPECIES: hypothetical protein [Bradyrhizobium]MCP1835040.1 ABC-type amino acid transport system permease subunit [Bradyrhizobium sp. USDA 4545]MCP1838001.1 ABC-type amino acid transport system permease subunit [Bradyrhizobium sp. USDA 4538]MCP1854149.1 ABC-type amino acid transport system permease subunit [Bradyrhizobium sp. USDA 4541]MCP1898566.1 ABC-type amino acid transport system permease subunit [Bradyrhizobium sp. USDA 4537]MCP1919785.1 ABC-type amino acid transport system permea
MPRGDAKRPGGTLFVGVIYFVFCFAMSRYSRGLEAQRLSN